MKSSWEEIEGGATYQSYTPEDQHRVKLGYFQENIASSETYQSYEEEDRRRVIMGFWADDIQKARTPQAPEQPKKERGVVGELGTAVVRGMYGSGEMYGRAGRVVGVDTSEFVKDMTERGEEYAATKHGKVWDSINQGISSTVQSVTGGIPGTVAGGAIGGPTGMVVGYATGAAMLFSLSEYDRFLEEAEELGIPREDVHSEAIVSAIAEGGIEGITDIVGAKIFGLTGIKEPVKRGAIEALKRFTGRIGKFAAVEVPGEMATSAIQAQQRQKVGIPSPDPWEAAKQAIGPSIVQTILMGGGAEAVRTFVAPTEKTDIDRDKMVDLLKEKLTGGEVDDTTTEDGADEGGLEIPPKPKADIVEINLLAPKELTTPGARRAEIDRTWKEEAPAEQAQEPVGLRPSSYEQPVSEIATQREEERDFYRQTPEERARETRSTVATRDAEAEARRIRGGSIPGEEIAARHYPPEEAPVEESVLPERGLMPVSDYMRKPKAEDVTWEEPVEKPVEKPIKKPVEKVEPVVETPKTEIDKEAHEAATSPLNEKPEPTEAQKEAGNYEKGHVKVQGLEIAIENPHGSKRSGVSPEGKKWETTMTGHYGYFNRTEGKDGDQVDVFVNQGRKRKKDNAYIVDQVDPETGKFDEHKTLLGYSSKGKAEKAYLSNYEDGWQGLGNITEVPMDEFKPWVKEGKKTKPFAETEKAEKTEPVVTEPKPEQPIGNVKLNRLGNKPFINPREIKRGANKGKVEVTLTKGRDEDGNVIPGKKRIVERDAIRTWPEEKVEPKDTIKTIKDSLDKKGNFTMPGDTLKEHLKGIADNDIVGLINWANKQSPHVQRNLKGEALVELKTRDVPTDEIAWQQENIEPIAEAPKVEKVVKAEKPKAKKWELDSKSKKDRVEWSFTAKQPNYFEDKDMPHGKERTELKKDGRKHIYFSPNRPLSGLLTNATLPDIKISESGKYLFSKELLSPENIYNWELIPTGDARAPLAIEYYRAVHGNKAMQFYKDIKDPKARIRWQGAMIHKSTKYPGEWQLTYFDENGFSGDTQHKTELKAVEEALSDRYNKPMPGLIDDAMKNPKFQEGNTAVEKMQKEHRERMDKNRDKKPEVTEDIEITGKKDKTVKVDIPKAEAEALTPKEQKKYLLAEIDKAIEVAKDETPESVGKIYGGTAVAKEEEGVAWKENAKKLGTVTIEVPGDGVFEILNSKQSLRNFKKKAKSFPVSLPKMKEIKPLQGKPTGKRIVDFEGKYYHDYKPRKQGIIEKDKDSDRKNYYDDGWFSQGGYLIKLDKKPKTKIGYEEKTPDMGEAFKGDFVGAEILGESYDNTGNLEKNKLVHIHVKTENGKHYLYNADYIDSVLTQYPDAKISANKENGMALFKVGNKKVAGVMPMVGGSGKVGNIESLTGAVKEKIAGKPDLNTAVKKVIDRTKDQRGSFSLEDAKGTTLHADLVDVGRAVMAEGHTAYNKFRSRFKELLGNAWKKVRGLIKGIYSDVKKILSNEKGEVVIRQGKSFSDILTDDLDKELTKAKDTDIGWHKQTQPPQWIAKKYAEFKELFDRQIKRIKTRLKMLADSVAEVENFLAFGKKSQELEDITSLIHALDGEKVTGIKVKRFHTEEGDYVLNDEYYKQYREKLDKIPVPNAVKDAYVEVRKSLDKDLATVYNHMSRLPDIDESVLKTFRNSMGSIHNYFPHMRYGNKYLQGFDFSVNQEGDTWTATQGGEVIAEARSEHSVIRKALGSGGEVIYREHFFASRGFYRKARHIMKDSQEIADLKKEHGDFHFKTGKVEDIPEEVFAIPIPIEALEAVMTAAIERLPDAESKTAFKKLLPKAVSDALKSRGWGSHMIQRRNIPGYEKVDVQRVLVDYKSGLTGWITKMEAARDFSTIMAKVRSTENPKLWTAMRKYSYDMLENATAIDRRVDAARAVFFAKYLGLNVKTATLNLTQQIIAGWPRLGLETRGASLKVLKGAASDLVSVFTKQKNLSESEVKLLTDLYDEGLTSAQFLTEVRGKIGGNANSVINKAMEVLGKPMEVAERFNRASLALAAFRTAVDGKINNKKTLKRLGLKKGEKASYDIAKEFAEDIVNDAHFVYGKTNRPEAFRGHQVLKIASAGYTFRTFTHNLINLWTWMWKQDAIGKRAVMKSIAAMTVIGGVSSIPLYKTFMHLIRQLTGDDWGEEVIDKVIGDERNALRDMILYGVPAGMGFTLGGSIGMELPIFDKVKLDKSVPDQIQSNIGEVIGVPWAAGEDLWDAMVFLSDGQYGRAFENLAPSAFANIRKGYRLGTEGQKSVSGKPITLPGETKPTKLSKMEMLGKMSGYQPVSLTKGYDIYQKIQDFKAYKTKAKRDLADKYANAKTNKEKNKIIEQIKDWNQKQRDSGRPEYIISVKEFQLALQYRRRPTRPPRAFRRKAKELKEKHFE